MLIGRTIIEADIHIPGPRMRPSMRTRRTERREAEGRRKRRREERRRTTGLDERGRPRPATRE